MIISARIPLTKPTIPFHQTILNKCLEHSKEDPERKAIISSADPSDFLTFVSLRSRALSLANWFQKNGYKKGEVVLLVQHNSWAFVVSCLGAWSAGLVVTAASPQFSHFELSYQLLDSGAVGIITDEQCLPTVLKAEHKAARHILCTGKKPLSGTVSFSAALLTPPALSPVPVDMDNDLIVLPYSSGTTGTPKGVMITHSNYAHMLNSYVDKYSAEYRARGMDDFVPPEHTITFLPLYHAMGIFGMFFTVNNGTTQIMMTKFKMESLLQHIQDYHVMMVPMVPSVILALANSPLLDKYDLSSLMIIPCGSAPLAQSVVDKLRQKLPDIQVAQGYGMTETSVASHVAASDTPEGSIGLLMPGTQMKVVASDGSLCGPDQQGELWIRGPQIMRGYWKREKETRENFDRDGFMRTGDIVYFNEGGHTFVCDRAKELIKVHGKQVAPAELESVVLQLAAVADCCVVARDDAKSGEVPAVFVVKAEGASIDEKTIQEHVQERVAPYKRLRGGVYFVASLPRTPTGKLLRRKLKEELARILRAKL